MWFLLKSVKPEFSDNDFYSALLTKEFELGVGMQHPNIVRYYDFDEVRSFTNSAALTATNKAGNIQLGRRFCKGEMMGAETNLCAFAVKCLNKCL